MFNCNANNPHIAGGLEESILNLKFPVSPAELGRMAVSREACVFQPKETISIIIFNRGALS